VAEVGAGTVGFDLDGRPVEVPAEGTLLDALRGPLGVRTVKDGCAPQGQCGCCTVLVDGEPRVACVTPVRRVAGRAVTTVDGLVDARIWADALSATGGTQCGFCTPGIVVRLSSAQAAAGPDGLDRAVAAAALQGHLCRCTGWQPILDAVDRVRSAGTTPSVARRDLAAAAVRAGLEGGVPQRVGPEVALGAGGFAADTAPSDALVALPDGSGGWAVAPTMTEARRIAGRIQGRRTTLSAAPPLDPPPGDWARVLRTSWVEPAYLEPDASWCEPGGIPASPLANGGAFGAKADSPLPAVARRLADEHGRPVLALFTREDVVRLGPKRPPVAAGVRADGTGVLRVVATPGITAAIAAVAPDLVVEEVVVAGPATSAAVRGAGWAEALVLACAVGDRDTVRFRGAEAEAVVDRAGIRVRLAAGDPLDEVVLRSYVAGAAHQAYGWVTAEGIAVEGRAPDGRAGAVLDLTIRSFGVVRATDLPPVTVELVDDGRTPVPGSDAVFAAVAAATWRWLGYPPDWPAGVP
jgi:xanthine dehydrogenase small subunit